MSILEYLNIGGNMDVDLKDFHINGDPTTYRLVVITSVPEEWTDGRPYTYFHVGQIVVCTTTSTGNYPTEVGWGGKPGKHGCTWSAYTSLSTAIIAAKAALEELCT